MRIPWFIRRLLLLAGLITTGCAHRANFSTSQDASISAAITASDRIDGKAVVVESWLKSH
jgi:hypothetical protein